MQVGDLVTLSSYGKKIKRTGWVLPGDVGIIKSRGTYDSYQIIWCKSVRNPLAMHKLGTRGSSWDWSHHFDRRDLKHVK